MCVLLVDSALIQYLIGFYIKNKIYIDIYKLSKAVRMRYTKKGIGEDKDFRWRSCFYT